MFKQPNIIRSKLDQIGRHFNTHRIERALLSLSEAISDCISAINRAEKSGDQEYLDVVVDEETYYIEEFLGIAFVVCQTDITYVVSKIKSLHKYCKESVKVELTSTDSSKENIMKLGSKFLHQTPYTAVQVIDAFANYFKHREEWNLSWESPHKNARKTIKILRAVGASPFSTSNFRMISKKLGNKNFDNLMIFSDIIQDWRKNLHDKYEEELKIKGLL
ncbi:hypothetical protein NLC26_00340 [Candidatus Aminicenantes bacterium AC-708-M15]|jgi:hypothetical protein|nr:hypothetical protein [SCandidatus Aminicenantes bacterium Aminicenantia_JdfR_composite]MCP2596513.1 hypothetical protein [Candidatus Aminicenantes bacterium AC-335-G13]MCP2598678.1 hypothetical protein [Candidatus Aminicenantes bacterium AC-335-L06]MCP2603910.1 hypothetical protein [Candidatus Aminicenantes bacterium AC-708-M15]MCP2605723.1 hypothetical protein [Candidatus Aminicenantes bacterium AC-335-O07]MCP2618107.1 hypothetical protein [Candidatus Aminicenantes bacterium AC-335-A11]